MPRRSFFSVDLEIFKLIFEKLNHVLISTIVFGAISLIMYLFDRGTWSLYHICKVHYVLHMYCVFVDVCRYLVCYSRDKSKRWTDGSQRRVHWTFGNNVGRLMIVTRFQYNCAQTRNILRRCYTYYLLTYLFNITY